MPRGRTTVRKLLDVSARAERTVADDNRTVDDECSEASASTSRSGPRLRTLIPERPVLDISSRKSIHTEMREQWSVEELQVVYEAARTLNDIDTAQLAQILNNKTKEDVDKLLSYCRRTTADLDADKAANIYHLVKATTSLEIWMATIDTLSVDDARWIRRAYSSAMSILGRYEAPSFPPTDDNGDIPADAPNYAAIYDWLSSVMLNIPELPRLRPMDALIVLDLLEQLQETTNKRLAESKAPVEVLQRKHMLLTAPVNNSKTKPNAHKKMMRSYRRTGLALATEEQCDLMRFSEKEMKSLMCNPPVEFEATAPHNWPPALHPGKMIVLNNDNVGSVTSRAVQEDSSASSTSSSESDQDIPPDSLSSTVIQNASFRAIKRPFAQRLQGLNPFRLSKKYARLDLFPAENEDNNSTHL